ncbi:hypothetical protein B9Z55_007704 [Caenorhabditis nigoni]|uniref:BTB domain-containing protein n=1 Tax=Caenorhabditis nigoni TaxID=1611254 RepID=A0A2G5VAS8_9PELO|nr:hypothetical protein B9Z55_007704 [Caenorhabditis nigoni]
MATNEEGSMRIRTEPESTVPLENNQVIAETGEVTGSGGTSNAALLVEIQKLRSELIATTEDNRRKQEEMLQKLKSATEENMKKQEEMLQKFETKMEEMKKGMSEKLQSNEVLTSNDNSEKSGNIKNVSSSKSVKQFKLKHVFKDVSNFAENVMYYGEREDHDNVKWYIGVKRNNNHLSFYVYCAPFAPADKWSLQTKLEYKVVVEAKVTIVETTGLGKKKIRTFDESQKYFSDVILVVRDTKFYVSKMFLAAQSSVFKALLLGNFSESKQSEVALNGIDPDDFHYFLEVLYGESAIDDTNVEDVALLADMYETPTAIRKCEEFLLEKSKMTREKKLEIAIRYNLERLKAFE